MPLPLFLAGAGVLALFAGNKITERYQKHIGHVGAFPGETDTAVEPRDGSVVCCGVFELFDHSGIWYQDSIIELNGDGLVRQISPQRFMQKRSGEKIYVACDDNAQPLTSLVAAQVAKNQLYEVINYHVLTNNCHNFVWQCFSKQNSGIARFAQLNENLSQKFNNAICWHPAQY